MKKAIIKTKVGVLIVTMSEELATDCRVLEELSENSLDSITNAGKSPVQNLLDAVTGKNKKYLKIEKITTPYEKKIISELTALILKEHNRTVDPTAEFWFMDISRSASKEIAIKVEIVGNVY